MKSVEQDFNTIIEALERGDEVQVRGDGFKYVTYKQPILRKFVEGLTANQLRDTAHELRQQD